MLLVALAGAIVALAGGLWDDSWHTERGRDEFFIAPHLAIYGGVTGVGGALTAWVLLSARRVGIARTLAHAPLRLAAAAVAMTLLSAPIDNAWHVAFGRDAVIWSPPHMLGIAGTLALAAALLAELRERPEPWAPGAATVAGAAVLSAAAFSTVEYDTDVPQFAVTWFLPVLALTSSFALALVQGALDRPWTATRVALIHLGFLGGISLFLVALDFRPPALPLLIVPAVVLDVARRRRAAAPLAAVAYAVALTGTYWAVRNGFGDGVRFDATDVLVGVAASALIVFGVLGALGWRTGSLTPTASVAVLALLLSLGAAARPSSALAHDPGQGPDAGAVDLAVRGDGPDLVLRAQLPSACPAQSGAEVVARRAGVELRRPAVVRGCSIVGRVRVTGRGRWFLYARWSAEGERREAWLPIVVGRGVSAVRDPARFAYQSKTRSSSPPKVVGGIVLYGAVVLLLAQAWRVVRRPRRLPGDVGAPG